MSNSWRPKCVNLTVYIWLIFQQEMLIITILKTKLRWAFIYGKKG